MLVLDLDELEKLYKRIKSGEATDGEKMEFKHNLMTGCLKEEFVIEELEKKLKRKTNSNTNP